MKIKKRTLKRTLKYLVCIALLFSLFTNISLLIIGAESQTTSSHPHEYHEGIVDGGVYYLHNLGYGGVLTTKK